MMDMFTDSDYESYGDSTDTGGLDGIESTYSEHAQSLLSCLDGSIEKIDDFLAFQRGFVHGDIVRSNMDPSKQLGRVVDVNMSVDLETSSGELIEGVNSRKLSRIRAFSPGDYVIHGHWLGRVSRVIDRVTVLLKNGSTCEIMDGDSDDLEPTSPILFNDGSSPQFYPGQNVSIKHHTSSDNAKWLCGSWKASQTDGIICHVEVGLVHVKWITSFMCLGSISSPPDHRQDPQMLTLLSPFSYANWQIGDCCNLVFDYQHYSKTDKDLISPTIAPQFKKTQQPGAIDQLSKKVYYIEKTRIKVDVLWQNGEVTVGVDPEGLLPVTNIGDHDFWPGQFVKENATCVDMHTSNVHLLGIVKCVEPREQIVKVKWLTSEHKPALKVERSTKEIVSVYELVELPDASYSLGDIVIRFLSYDKLEENISKIHVNTEQTQVHRSIPSNSTTTLLQVDDCKNKVCLPDHDNSATSYTSHIGFVTGFKEESIEVRWASGLISKVHPYEVFGLDRLNELDSSSSAHQAMEYVQNEMPEHANQSSNENEVGNDYNGGFNRVLWDSGILLLPQTAFRMLNNIAARLFSTSSFSLSYQKLSEISRIDRIGESSLTPHSSLTKHNPKLVDGNIPVGLHTSDVKMVSLPGDEMHLDDWKEAIKCGVEQIGGSVFMAGSGKPERFKQFDCVMDYFDHHFVNSTSKNGTASQVKSSWLRRIQQEWSIITEGLPESICVRVYEERVDLLRASIAGQCGTPYYHGLFFFDIHLPDNYPQEPPHVHYHSGGLRLNPNLYESGKICLSLLNTWAGSGSETWNPPSSTILQLLLSLQALVLNDKPYFNEAGYDQQIGRAEAERNSINYNENAFLLTCKSMLYILKRPPKHFEALVAEHFADRARDIVLACKAYMGGARVGSYGSGTDPGEANSAGFRLMLAKVLPMIVSTFTEKGFDCSQ